MSAAHASPDAGPTRAARVAGVAVPAAIGGVAAIHAAWAAGWHWPGGSEQALAERVLGTRSTEMPPGWLTWLVATTFAASATAVAAAAAGSGGRPARLATWATAGVFTARGVLGPIADAFTGPGTYERLDLAIYSPLCLAIGSGAAALAWRAGERVTPAR